MLPCSTYCYAAAFGHASKIYRPDQAISDLLAILDDRIESEGVQVGLSVEFLHQMWMLCNKAKSEIENTVWLQRNLDGEPATKSRVRDLTYRELIDYLENLPEDPSAAFLDE